MAWIEVHQSLRGHKKLSKLCELLNIKCEAHAVGYLVCLWLWAVDNAPDGNLAGINDRIIANAAAFTREKKANFVGALMESGFLNKERALHDWLDYAGRLIERRQANTERMRAARRKAKEKTDVNEQGACDTCAGLPYPTVPNRTQPNQNLEGRNNNQQPGNSACARAVGADSISAPIPDSITAPDSKSAPVSVYITREQKRAKRAFWSRIAWMEGLPSMCQDACGEDAAGLVNWLLFESGANDEQICSAFEYMQKRHLAGDLRKPMEYVMALIKDWQEKGLDTAEDIQRNREAFFS